MKSLFHCFLIVSLFFISSCKKDDNSSDGPSSPTPGGIIRNVSGVVFSPEGIAMSGAQVSVNGSAGITDSEGVFRLVGASLQDGVNFLSVSKPGFFNGGRSFYPGTNTNINLNVTLSEKVLAGIVDGSTGGQVSDVNGVEVDLEANTIAGGYNGNVYIYTAYINPMNQANAAQIPGLDATNTIEESGVLQSYGMSHIQLEDDNGNVLNLADGQSAEIAIPVPSELTGGASSSIPLWYFDETDGIWKEEGEAQLEGDKYVGSVPHFTIWNADLFVCSYYQVFQLLCGGEPLANVTVEFRYDGSNIPAGVAVTNNEGKVYKTVPCSETLSLYAVDPGVSQLSLSIGSVTTPDSPEPLIQINLNCPDAAKAVGSAINASFSPVTNGYVYLKMGDFKSSPAFFNSSGEFEISAFDLSGNMSTAEIVAWDLSTSITVNGPNVPVNNETTNLENPIQIAGEVAQPEGLIYVGTDENVFYCLDAENGNEVWTFNTGGINRAGAAIMDNILHFGCQDGQVYGLNANDGSIIWNLSDGNDNSNYNAFLAIDGSVFYSNTFIDGVKSRASSSGLLNWNYSANTDVQTAPTYSNGVIYSGHANGFFQALDATNGQLIWEYETGDDINSSAAVAQDLVYFGSNDGTFYALNATTGTLEWSDDSYTGSLSGEPTIENGVVFFPSQNAVKAYNAETGSVLWTGSYAGFGTPEIYADQARLYVFTADGLLLCVNANNGQTIWEVDPEGNAMGVSPIIVDDVLYHSLIGFEQYKLMARDANSGALIWEKNLNDACRCPLMIVDDNGDAHYSTSSGMKQ